MPIGISFELRGNLLLQKANEPELSRGGPESHSLSLALSPGVSCSVLLAGILSHTNAKYMGLYACKKGHMVKLCVARIVLIASIAVSHVIRLARR